MVDSVAARVKGGRGGGVMQQASCEQKPPGLGAPGPIRFLA